jgi:hypothetical protein
MKYALKACTCIWVFSAIRYFAAFQGYTRTSPKRLIEDVRDLLIMLFVERESELFAYFFFFHCFFSGRKKNFVDSGMVFHNVLSVPTEF